MLCKLHMYPQILSVSSNCMVRCLTSAFLNLSSLSTPNLPTHPSESLSTLYGLIPGIHIFPLSRVVLLCFDRNTNPRMPFPSPSTFTPCVKASNCYCTFAPWWSNSSPLNYLLTTHSTVPSHPFSQLSYRFTPLTSLMFPSSSSSLFSHQNVKVRKT